MSNKISKKLRFEDLLFEPEDNKNVSNNFDNLISLVRRRLAMQQNEVSISEIITSQTAFLEELIINLEDYFDQIERISCFAHEYDSVTRTKANGYRTFVGLSSTLVRRLTQLLLEMQSKSQTTNRHQRELEAWAQAVKDLSQINRFLIEIHDSSKPGELFPSEPDVLEVENLARRVAQTDLSMFYGILAAFYLKGDAQAVVKQVALALAMYSDIYTKTYHGMGFNFLSNFVNITMYNFDTERIVKSLSSRVREVPVEFCKSYYNFPESGIIGKFVARNDFRVECNTLIKIPPDDQLMTQDLNGKSIHVPVPMSHIGKCPLNARLIAPFRTAKMVGCKCRNNCTCSRSTLRAPSSSIFFHLHGGGFVSQTSKSHETYLKQWATEWDIPILSIDYSLAPEAPYPRALEEVVYAYAWMRENFAKLGTTGAKVIFGGDSAGGNLSLGLFLRCLDLNLPRPDSIFLFYPSLLCEMYPSPSRLICLMDPMVMFPFLMRCINAYADQNYKQTCPRTFSDEVEGCKFYNDPLMSPLLIPARVCALFPPIHLFSTDVDPCLDETIAFSNKLVRGGAPRVTLDVLGGLPHGFLSLNGMSVDCKTAVDLLTLKLKELLPIC